MPGNTDKRGRLNEPVFAYKITKDKKVFISYDGRTVTTLSGARAERFAAEIEAAEGAAAQLIMAKATGNFRRGNEKPAKRRPR